ncbi:MASE4 domain-containing protein [Microvirga sp. 2MCAF35]|uniref:MASE4 domain-containing protein n=1 Tax=Microvirga sp. 2MCAF35 TaxID=3232987 RepID=UPI003F99FF34
MAEAQSRHPFLLSTAIPNRRQRRLAVGILAALIAAMLLVAPFAHVGFPGTEILIPAYAAAAFLIELLTAAFLFALFSVDRSRAVLLLGTGYLFSGLLVIPWSLTFPGVFTALGLDPDIQVTAVIAASRRLGFAVFILAYALTKDRKPRDRISGSLGRAIMGRAAGVAGVVLLLVLAAVLRADDLPAFMRDAREVTPLWHYVPVASVLLYLASLVTLGTRLRSTLDLWLMVVLATLLAHPFWTFDGPDRGHQTATFFEHVAIVGGLAASALFVNSARQRR